MCRKDVVKKLAPVYLPARFVSAPQPTSSVIILPSTPRAMSPVTITMKTPPPVMTGAVQPVTAVPTASVPSSHILSSTSAGMGGIGGTSGLSGSNGIMIGGASGGMKGVGTPPPVMTGAVQPVTAVPTASVPSSHMLSSTSAGMGGIGGTSGLSGSNGIMIGGAGGGVNGVGGYGQSATPF